MTMNLSGRVVLTSFVLVLIACLFGAFDMDRTAKDIFIVSFGGLFLSAFIWIWKDSYGDEQPAVTSVVPSEDGQDKPTPE